MSRLRILSIRTRERGVDDIISVTLYSLSNLRISSLILGPTTEKFEFRIRPYRLSVDLRWYFRFWPPGTADVKDDGPAAAGAEEVDVADAVEAGG